MPTSIDQAIARSEGALAQLNRAKSQPRDEQSFILAILEFETALRMARKAVVDAGFEAVPERV